MKSSLNYNESSCIELQDFTDSMQNPRRFNEKAHDFLTVPKYPDLRSEGNNKTLQTEEKLARNLNYKEIKDIGQGNQQEKKISPTVCVYPLPEIPQWLQPKELDHSINLVVSKHSKISRLMIFVRIGFSIIYFIMYPPVIAAMFIEIIGYIACRNLYKTVIAAYLAYVICVGICRISFIAYLFSQQNLIVSLLVMLFLGVTWDFFQTYSLFKLAKGLKGVEEEHIRLIISEIRNERFPC